MTVQLILLILCDIAYSLLSEIVETLVSKVFVMSYHVDSCARGVIYHRPTVLCKELTYHLHICKWLVLFCICLADDRKAIDGALTYDVRRKEVALWYQPIVEDFRMVCV